MKRAAAADPKSSLLSTWCMTVSRRARLCRCVFGGGVEVHARTREGDRCRGRGRVLVRASPSPLTIMEWSEIVGNGWERLAQVDGWKTSSSRARMPRAVAGGAVRGQVEEEVAGVRGLRHGGERGRAGAGIATMMQRRCHCLLAC